MNTIRPYVFEIDIRHYSREPSATRTNSFGGARFLLVEETNGYFLLASNCIGIYFVVAARENDRKTTYKCTRVCWRARRRRRQECLNTACRPTRLFSAVNMRGTV